MKKYLFKALLFVLGILSMLLPPLFSVTEAEALSYTFSDQDFLSGASWGTMNITAFDNDTLAVRYDAAPDTIIPSGSQVTGFGFAFGSTPTGVANPADGDNTGDRDDLDWIVLNNLNAIPNPANGDEFIPNVTKFDFDFGVTEGNANNFNPPGILPGEFDIYFINFTGLIVDLSALDLTDFVDLTGIRLQSLPDDISGGSLFLVGDNGGNGQVPEPGTIVLFGSGLIGLALYRRLRF